MWSYFGCGGGEGREAYCEFAGAPEALDHAELVEGHGGEEHFGAVCVAELPGEEAPELVVLEDVWADLDPAEVLGVG